MQKAIIDQRRGFCPNWITDACLDAVEDAYSTMFDSTYDAEEEIEYDLDDEDINVNWVEIKPRRHRSTPCRWHMDNHRSGQIWIIIGKYEVTIDFCTK